MKSCRAVSLDSQVVTTGFHVKMSSFVILRRCNVKLIKKRPPCY